MTAAAMPTSSRALLWLQAGRVMLSAWQARRNQGSMWGMVLIVALLATLPVIPLLILSGDKATMIARIVGAFSAVSVLMIAWTKLVFNVLLQNHPQLAKVMPGQVKRLRWVLWLGVAALSGVAELFSWLAGWPVLPVGMGVAIGSTVLVCGMRWPWLWFVMGVLPSMAPLWSALGRPEGLALIWRSAPWPLQAAAVAAGVVLTLRATVMNGGERHTRAHARLLNLGAMMRGQTVDKATRQPGGVGLAWEMRMRGLGYAAWLARLTRPGASTATTRLAMGMGPQVHWTGVLGGALFGWFFVALVMTVGWLLPQWELLQTLRGSLMLGMAFASITVAIQVPVAMWASRREQVLLRLLPGAPQGPQLNRWLAKHMAVLQLTSVVLQTVSVTLLSALIAMPPGWERADQIALGALVLSPLTILMLWRDWSRLKAPSGTGQIVMMLVAIVWGGGTYAWVAWLDGHWWSLAAITLLAFMPFGWWRWRVIAHAPTAWPAGRA